MVGVKSGNYPLKMNYATKAILSLTTFLGH